MSGIQPWECGMPALRYRCPYTGKLAEVWTEAAEPDDSGFVDTVVCNACGKIHLVDPRDGRVVGAKDEDYYHPVDGRIISLSASAKADEAVFAGRFLPGFELIRLLRRGAPVRLGATGNISGQTDLRGRPTAHHRSVKVMHGLSSRARLPRKRFRSARCSWGIRRTFCRSPCWTSRRRCWRTCRTPDIDPQCAGIF